RHAHDPQLRARFFREAKLVAKLRDRVVVTLHDYGESPEVGLYMAFELIEGATLAKVLKEGPQPTERVANILLQLLRALAEAHGLGMIHRDLKPGNIMLVEDPGSPLGEGVRLLDFGIAKLKVEMAGQDPSLATQQGLFMGTPSYISPEQARASGEVDGRSDLYSLGVVGYALLAGKNPFVGTSVVETILAHCNTAPPPLEDTLQVPAQMEGALRKALEKSPEDRFASAMQMAAAIEAAVPSLVSGVFMRSWAEVPEPLTPSAGAAVQAIPETAQSETWSQALPFVDPQRPLRWALLLILLLVSVGLAGLWFANTGEDSYPREPTTAAMPPQPPPSAEAAALEPTTPAIEEAPEPADVEVSSAPADPAPSELPAKLEAPSEATPERSEQTRPVRPRRRERSAEPRRPAPEESEPTLVIPEF
ncbi:MAG: protein kinase, partial [Myxococcota bacterium]